MSLFPNRSLKKEILDDMDMKGEILYQTLHQLAFINRYLGNVASLIPAIFREIRKKDLQHVHLIDLGCGGGDILFLLENHFRNQKISYQLTGIDGNRHALKFAKTQVGANSKIQFYQQDILDEAFSLDNCDILISSHFIYHFDNKRLITFLKKNRPAVKHAIFISELTRNRIAYFLFGWVSLILGFNKVIREDGKTAIKRAFTKAEIESVPTYGQQQPFQVERKLLFRMLIRLS